MDYEVIWTDEALCDVEEIAKYIEKDSFFYASSVVTKIIDTTSLLESFPFAGRIIPEENDESVREHFVYSYRVAGRSLIGCGTFLDILISRII
jgi:plasmid stabilization system protein ParE